MTANKTGKAALWQGFLILFTAALVLTPGPGFSAELGPREDWLWPSGAPVRVLDPFDPPAQRWLSGHRGVDLEVGVGAQVLAPAAGTVIYAGPLAHRNVISLRHASGLHLTFEPVLPVVRAGEEVAAGQVLGVLQAGHKAGALHWGAKYPGDHYIDPLSLLLGPIRLKPWDQNGL